ncbi:response regulator transcription factor [Chelativorans alearense]|uniref:response regulator transcription factor n=1 Tax=Chelativorans alearense TaxID=2681495 RepID=UPI0013D716FD|nr:response regulator transcription factor [Chelativorans alearense]
MTKQTILIVDDDDELRSMLKEQLTVYDEFQILDEGTAAKGIQAARSNIVHAAIMDVGLPDIDGREAVKILRRTGFKAPIIMLTARDGDADTILGLESGANDYVTKPFHFAVLLARIRTHLRQHARSDDAVFRIRSFLFQPGKKMLVDERGARIRLTDKETALIKYLYSAQQKVVSRNELLEKVWDYNSDVTSHTLETHVHRLRQKIERNPANAEILVTEGGGYKLVM